MQLLLLLLLEGCCVKEIIGFRTESELHVVTDLAGCSEIEMIVCGEPENRGPRPSEPPKEPSHQTFVLEHGVVVPVVDVVGRGR